MARSDVQHYGLLNRWPHIMQENPWHFNQLAGVGAPLSHPCDAAYIQEERDALADALNLAVEMVAEQLGFYPRPTWVQERLYFGGGSPLEWQPHKLRYGYIEEVGIRTTALIQAGVAITYSDANSDGVDDTATITVTTAVATDEIGAFFRVSDGAESAGHAFWEIEPLTSVTASGGVVTITAPRYLFAKPSVWAQSYAEPSFTDRNAKDTLDPNNFVTNVDIYRVYSDATAAVQITGDPLWTRCDDLDSAVTENGVALILDSRLGIVRVRLECDCFDSYPESVYLSYKAGYPLDNGKMARRLETNIIRLANTLLPYQPATFCDRTLNMWQQDMEELDPSRLTATDLHPFGGTKQGAIVAWRNLRHLALGAGGKVTV